MAAPVVTRRLILASQSPRRRGMLEEAGYSFEVQPASDAAESGQCSGETPAEMVARYAFRKAEEVAKKIEEEAIVLGCDTVAEWQGTVFGKPAHEDHAREILKQLRGKQHLVHTGICLWLCPENQPLVKLETTVLEMKNLSDEEIEEYLESGLWEGKAGAFGYQDRTGWLSIVQGSESNVVGLPLERLQQMLKQLDLLQQAD
ncbi:Nucleoside triphosphate pyrophosphatase [Planctomycetales bacterium 10988]|nr:Nucleoside triphosphate pyrophosphatase [Planctomycetales bacterium 10988]